MREEIAYNRMASLCSRREMSSAQVEVRLRKLLGAEGEEERCKHIVERLKSEGFLDDRRFALAYVNDKLRFNGWGRRKIELGLAREGVPAQIINEAIEERYKPFCGEIARKIAVAKERELRKRGLTGFQLRGRLMAYMNGRGFDLPDYNLD